MHATRSIPWSPFQSRATRATVRCSIAFLWVLALLAVAIIPPSAAGAQGRIAGVVRDSTGAGVAGAEITVAGTTVSAESDEAGAFVLAGIPVGAVAVRVRRLGFTPVSIDVVVQSRITKSLTVVLANSAPELTPVVIRAQRHRQYTGYLAGFYERRDRGLGRFITGEEIQSRDPLELTDMLRTLPGITVSSSGLGTTHTRIRGNHCAPLVWIDGAPAAAAEFDLDVLSPASIAGIEIYSGPSTVPPQFVLPFGPTACGTIVVWSRHGEPSQRNRRQMTGAQLDSLLAIRQIYTADQVDEPARANPSAPITPQYPDSLYKARVPGRVVVDFVVDTTGHVDMETFGVVSSTDPLFTEAVRRALLDATFTSGRIAGHSVPQLVRQPFDFTLSPGDDHNMPLRP